MAQRNVSLSGSTRVFFIVGDPIAQVKAPSGVTMELLKRGHDAVVVPIHVGA
jgi:shikimate dehydrogenase